MCNKDEKKNDKIKDSDNKDTGIYAFGEKAPDGTELSEKELKEFYEANGIKYIGNGIGIIH